ncbi:hypothetical protein QKE52_04355 [Corynebacterium sp. c25Ua_47]|uniref:hypothetical protein n=1 Tax=Corynebacterium sp. c25Ua_47 TaxID=3032353 RepID=UPI003262DE64
MSTKQGSGPTPPPGPGQQRPHQHGGPQQNPYANQPFPPLGTPHNNPGGGYGAAQPQPEPPKKKSVVGIIATVLAVLGTIIACIPGIYAAGWILLLAALIAGAVSLFLSNQSTVWGAVALIITVVGSLIASVVFFFFMAAKFIGSLPDTTQTPEISSSIVGTTVRPWDEEETLDSTGSPTPTATEYYESVPDENGNQVIEEGTPGSRSNPLPLNTTLEGPEWHVDVSNLNFDGTDEVMAADPSYKQPDEGKKYLVFDLTLTYVGNETDAGSEMAFLYFGPGEESNGQPLMWDVNGFIDVDTPFQPQEKRTGRVAVSVPENGAEDGTFGIVVPGTEIPFHLALK